MGYLSAKLRLIVACIMAVTALMPSLDAQSARHLSLNFENVIGKKHLHLDTVTYMSKSGQPFTVTNFKYYISNIKLIYGSGKTVENKNSYYLISADDTNSLHIVLEDVPPDEYEKISFTIGVDSLHNCTGAQSGALDPVNGMFWTWNSGYIFMKLEGKSPDSKQPGHIFEYHIGGYKEPANCIRTVTLDLNAEEHYDEVTSQPGYKGLPVMTGIDIRADISDLLSSSFQIDFSKLSSVTDYHNAEKIADNYQKMFQITGIFKGAE